MCITNWKATLTVKLQWNIEIGGLSFYSFFNGCVKLRKMKRKLTPIPM